MLPDDLSALIQSRHSIRDFRPDPVPDSVLDSILDDARHAPSWSNTRPYCLALATGARLERLRETYTAKFDESIGLQRRTPSAVAKALVTGGLPDGDFKAWKRYPDDLRPRSVAVGTAMYSHLGIRRDDQEARDTRSRRNCEFFGAPAVAWAFVHDGLLPFSAMDVGLMLQTLALSAQAHGVDSCFIGTLAVWRAPIDVEFEIPSHYKLITGLALGYRSDATVNSFRAEHPPIVRVEARPGPGQ